MLEFLKNIEKLIFKSTQPQTLELIPSIAPTIIEIRHIHPPYFFFQQCKTKKKVNFTNTTNINIPHR
jgi:hypothetical protein